MDEDEDEDENGAWSLESDMAKNHN